MKCDIIQRRLLTAERPEQHRPSMKRHLADCSACRAVYQRLLQLDSDLARLPVPPSTRQPAFVQGFLQQTAVEVAPQAVLPLVQVTRRAPLIKERGLRKLAFAFALAASLAVFALGWGTLHFKGHSRAVDYTAVHRIQLDTRLRSADTPLERMETIVSVADDVRDEVRLLAKSPKANPEQLAALAQYYRQLLQEDLESRVQALPEGGNRKAALKNLEDQLRETESEFSLLAVTQAATPAEKSLRDIALAARETCNHIHEMLEAS